MHSFVRIDQVWASRCERCPHPNSCLCTSLVLPVLALQMATSYPLPFPLILSSAILSKRISKSPLWQWKEKFHFRSTLGLASWPAFLKHVTEFVKKKILSYVHTKLAWFWRLILPRFTLEAWIMHWSISSLLCIACKQTTFPTLGQ